MKVTTQTSSGAAKGEVLPAVAAVPSDAARAAAQICSWTTGRSGHPLRWVRPQGEEAKSTPSHSASGNRQNGVLSAEIAESSAGLQKLSPADPPQLQVIFADHQELAGPTGTLAAQTDSVPPVNRSANEDAFTNPFEDPLTTPAKPKLLAPTVVAGEAAFGGPPVIESSQPKVEPMANVGENFEGLSPSPEVKTFRSRSPAGSGNSSQQFQPELRSPAWAELQEIAAAQPGADRPEPLPLPENQPPKPLGDQLAAGPMVSPDICPEPADAERPLPNGLTPIRELTHDIPKGEGRLPQLCPMSEEKIHAPASRGWSPLTFTWTASALCHKPAYFEQVQVERYGHSWGPILQPVISGAHFFLTIPILPYKMGLYPPNECIYTLGYYRPGSCAPYMLDPLPFSLRAALFQAGAWTAGVFVIP